MYPSKLKECFALNGETVASLSYGLLKRHLSKEAQTNIHTGGVLHGLLYGHRVDALYNGPSFEAAQEKMTLDFLLYFLERSSHKRDFSLDTAFIVEAL